MGVLFHLLDLSFHLLCYYFLREDRYFLWYVFAELVWCFLKILTTVRVRPACSLAHLTDLRADRPKHPEMEHVEWLNDLIHRLWTPINRSLQKVVRDEVTATINKEIRKKISMTFEFIKVDLGIVPFEIEGISSHRMSLKEDELCLDVDMAYHGDAEFVVRIGYLRAGIKNLRFNGTMRVMLQPILNESPVIGGMHLYFLQTPTISYEFTNFLNFLNFDAVAGVIDKALHTMINRHMVAPNAIHVHITHNQASHDLDVDLPIGIVRVHLIEALQLEAADLHGASNPFVQFVFGKERFSSPVAADTLNPVWNQHYQFNVFLRNLETPLEFTIYDKDELSQQILGEGRIDILRIEINGMLEEFYKLEKVKSGVLHLRLDWRPLSYDANDFDLQIRSCQMIKEKTESQLAAGYCYIVITSKAKSSSAFRKGAIETQVKAITRLGTITQASRRFDFSKTPAWKEVFCLPMYDLESDNIEIEILDGLKDVRFGMATVKVSEVLKERRMVYAVNFNCAAPGSPVGVVNARVLLRTFRGEKDISVIFNPDINVRAVQASRIGSDPINL